MSRYFKHAQATINCDHCGGVNDVKHYCLICEETICSTCKAIHNKARATRDHQVVLREERHTKDQTSTFCKKHPDQKTSLHCDTCNVPVCTKCIAETHYGHRFSDIAKVLMTFHKKLLHSKRLMQDRMKQINFLIKREEQNWHDYESAVKVLESCIKRDASTLKSMVDKLEQGRTNELESIKRHDRKAWEAVKGRLEEEKTKIYSCLAQHDECLSSQTTAGMTELLNESIILQNTSINPMKVTAPSYRSSHAASVEGIGDIIMNANIQTRVPVDNLNVFKAKVISSFSCKLMGVPAMCYFGNGLVMISTKDSSDIQMVDIQGNVVQKREMVLKDKCWSLAVHNSGDIIVSPIGRQRIENLGSQNLLKTLLDTSPYTPHFVTVTQKQEILVCLCKYNFDTNEGRVMLFDKKGGNKRYLTNNNAYEYPIQAIDLPGEGFCISDKYKERLIVLDKDFNVKHTIQKPLGQNEFWPQGICTDKAGNILATDKKNDCVYLIRKNMNVELLVGVTHGIKDPKCLCVDDDNNLWIAQWNGEIKKIILTMSLSKSANFEHAQATIQCDHCGEVDDVKHYCLICEETMCPTCKAIHNKARATRDHQVVLREERHTKDQGSTFCKKHPDQKTSLHCDTCNVPVCTKCIAEAHNGHKFSDISKILRNFKREIEDSKKKMETRMKEVTALIQKGEQNWKDYEDTIKSIETQISHDAVSLRSIVDKMEQKRKDELNNIKLQDKTNWETAKGGLDVEKTNISTSLVQHDEFLSSTTSTGMAELLKDSKVLRSKRLDLIEILPPSYQTPSNTSVEGIGEIMKQSKIPTTVHSNKLKVGRPEVISSFKSTLEGKPSICYAGNGQVLIGTTHSKDIHIINIKGNIVHKRENVLTNKCCSLAVTHSGDIVVSPHKGNQLDILRKQNKSTALFPTSPYETRFINVTEKQEILLCMSKNVDLLTNKGRVILCNSKGGNRRHIGTHDMHEEPIQAVQLQDGGFCISDSGKQHLVVLNTDGNIRYIIQNPLGRERFWPGGICTDKAGNIMATDAWNHCVYVIGKDMSIRELVGKAERIKYPRCLCVDDDNNLWIAQDNGQIKVF